MEKISEKVYFIRGKNSGRFPFCNVLLVDNVLIDAGAGIEIIKELAKKTESLVLSHTHPDHASGAWIFNELGKRVFAPKGVATDLDSLAIRFVTEKLSKTWKEFFTSPSIGMRSFRAEGYEEGLLNDMLKCKIEIEAVATPGHTDDHHVFIIDGKVIYGADIDLTPFGPFYGNPEGNMELFKKSIEKVLEFDVEVFVSSHADPIFGKNRIEEKLIWYLEFFDKRDEILLNLLNEPKSIEELVEISPFYRKKPYVKEMLDFFEMNMIKQHLAKLLREGKIKKIGEKYIKKSQNF